MEKKEIEPYFDLTKSPQIGKYVAYYVDVFRKESGKEAMVLKKLKLVFSPDFEYYLKVVDGKRFTPSFFQRIGKRREEALKYLLCKIDKTYSKFFKSK
jgi:hypothetical protein